MNRRDFMRNAAGGAAMAVVGLTAAGVAGEMKIRGGSVECTSFREWLELNPRTGTPYTWEWLLAIEREYGEGDRQVALSLAAIATDVQVEFCIDMKEITKPGDEYRSYKRVGNNRFTITGTLP